MPCVSMTALQATPWVLLAVVLFAAGLLALAMPALRRWRALRQAQRQDANARALLQIADALERHALPLARCGLGPESERWARLCRRAAYDRLSLINDLLLLSMRKSERDG